MKVLIVSRYKPDFVGNIAPFVKEQADALRLTGVDVEPGLLRGNYFISYIQFLRAINRFQPDVIHAHYGLTGLIANLQRKIPVVTTFHGSDLNTPFIAWLSRLAMRLSAFSVFVSASLWKKARCPPNSLILPCGVDLTCFRPLPKELARRKLNLPLDEQLVLFAGSFGNKVKNVELALQVVAPLPNVRLMELKGYSRHEVALLMNAVDVCLLTSHSEGSPQFIKEAMACNCPIVSVGVGDVAGLLEELSFAYCEDSDAAQLRNRLSFLLHHSSRSNGRQKIRKSGLGNIQIACRLQTLYTALLL